MMPDHFDAIVIGSGLGGLTAGALFAHAGHSVLVLEQNDTFGGAATTYHRGTMMIEASLHETADPRTTTADPKVEIFEALDLYQDIELTPVGDFQEVRCPLIGAPLVIPHGVDALRDSLTERFPHEADSIRHFLKRVGSIQTALQIFMEKHSGLWWLAHGAELPFRLWPVLRDMHSSVSKVLEKYFGNNEAIKIALAANLSYWSDDPDQMWWLMYAVAQGGFLQGGGVYIKGGSQVLSDRLVDRIREGDGEALADQTAIEILLDEQSEVSGVRYRPRVGGEDTVAHAPVIFANASPHVVKNMLPTAKRDSFMAPYRGKPLSTSLFSMNLGLNKRPSELGVCAYSTMIIPEWMERLSDYKHCAGLFADMPSGRLPAMGVCDYSYIDSGLVDGELFPVSLAGADRLTNWDGLSDTDYLAKKNAWLDALIECLDKEWPGFANAVVQREYATAKTMHNFLNTPGGAVYGFAPNVPDRSLLSGPPRTPKTSIKGLWLASSFAGMGGFSGAMGSGGWAAKNALREYM
ncbi:MAG: phytoene desaturase family protein [Gammaproteobacteria bacterium]